MKKSKKVLIVGGGVFGCTLALDLNSLGFDVTIFEKNNALLLEASLSNQYRLHRGFHYPRSPQTISETKAAAIRFEDRFPEVVLRDYKNRYAIASEGSRVTVEQYTAVMKQHDLKFNEIPVPPFLRNVDCVIETEEHLFSPSKLQRRLTCDLEKSKVKVQLMTSFDWRHAEDYDAVILCTYGANDVILRQGGYEPRSLYRVQLVEKPVVALPESLRMHSLVVIDGAFCSMDPLDGGEYSVVGHVSEAVHYMSDNCERVDPEIFEMLERSRASGKAFSRFEQMQQAIMYFMPDFKMAKHVRSNWAVRVVPGNVSSTDERPTEVARHSASVFSVFSGKFASCVTVLNMLEAQAPELFDR